MVEQCGEKITLNIRLENKTSNNRDLEERSLGCLGTDTYLFHHLVLLVEELHLDVSTHRQRLRKLKVHVFLLSPCVHWVGGVDFHLQLVHHKLRICEIKQCVIAIPALCDKLNVSLCIC